MPAKPLPSGRGVGIVTNVGGPAILCADACESAGLAVAALSDKTRARLREFLPPAASVGNPVDMIATATAEQYAHAIEVVADDPEVAAIVVLFIPPLAGHAVDVADAILNAARALKRRKPLLAVMMSSDEAQSRFLGAEPVVPLYDFPEPAAIALGHAVRYAEWHSKRLSVTAEIPGVRRDDAVALVAQALGRGDGWLDAASVVELLRCYGLPLVDYCLTNTPEAAGQAADRLGGSVALKGLVPGVLHKTEAGLVRLDLKGADQVRETAADMAANVDKRGEGRLTYLVQRMAQRGVEMIVGVVHDPQFGPLVACGAGGTLVELLKDVAVRLTPLSREDASEMIRGLRTYPLLHGYRGSALCDVSALEDVLLHVSALVDDIPQIAELDLNPVVVLPTGCAILDARIRLER